MLELQQTNPISLQVKFVSEQLASKKTIFIVGAIVVFIAALVMFFVLKNYFFKISHITESCNNQCQENFTCQNVCGLKSTASATVSVIVIFVFILVILSVYFVLSQNLLG